MKTIFKFASAGVYFLLFVLLIVLLKTLDVAAIGPGGTSVGLSGVNEHLHEFFGVNTWLYTATEWIGYAAIAAACSFAILGLVQLIRRKSLFKVDREIIALGIVYIVVILIYAVFEFIVINYRPVLMAGESAPEASFPSSHTMLVGVIAGSAALLLPRYLKNRAVCLALQIVGCAAILFTIVGRMISGVHWFTDIFGGVLITAALLFAFSGVLDLIAKKAECSPTDEIVEKEA